VTKRSSVPVRGEGDNYHPRRVGGEESKKEFQSQKRRGGGP